MTRCTLFLLLSALSGVAQISLTPASALPFGPSPEGLAAGDFDQDGDIDLAAAVDAPDRVVLYLNAGNGTFAPGTAIFTGAGSSPHALGAADLDADGRMDLVVTLKNNDQVAVYRNLAAGAFVLSATYATGTDPRHLALGDLNADGSPDLVVGNRDSNSLNVFVNSGLGVFGTSVTLAGGQEPRYLAIGDLDNDGDGDIAFASHDDRTVRRYRNDGLVFTAMASLFVAPQVRPDGLAIVDVNGDGLADLATTISDQTFNIHGVSIFTNAGANAFVGPITYPVGGQEPGAIVAADFDGDGDLDVATALKTTNNVCVLTNTAGTFGAPLLFATGTTPENLVAADLNGNGSPDLATTNQTSNDGSVLLNGSVVIPPTPPLAFLTAPTVGTTSQIRITSPSDAGRAYQFALAFGNTPGIMLGDGRVLALNPDDLFFITIQPFNPFLQGGIGALNANGQATVGVIIPFVPSLAGFTIHSAFLAYAPTAPSGVATVSPSLAITFQ